MVYETNCCVLWDKCIGVEEEIMTFAAGREGDLCVDVTAVSIWDETLFQDAYRPHTQKEM